MDETGTPGIIRHRHVGLGLAIDLTRANGEHSLVVPVIRDADLLDFTGFLHAAARPGASGYRPPENLATLK